jgi:hypothetical protein
VYEEYGDGSSLMRDRIYFVLDGEQHGINNYWASMGMHSAPEREPHDMSIATRVHEERTRCCFGRERTIMSVCPSIRKLL